MYVMPRTYFAWGLGSALEGEADTWGTGSPASEGKVISTRQRFADDDEYDAFIDALQSRMLKLKPSLLGEKGVRLVVACGWEPTAEGLYRQTGELVGRLGRQPQLYDLDERPRPREPELSAEWTRVVANAKRHAFLTIRPRQEVFEDGAFKTIEWPELLVLSVGDIATILDITTRGAAKKIQKGDFDGVRLATIGRDNYSHPEVAVEGFRRYLDRHGTRGDRERLATWIATQAEVKADKAAKDREVEKQKAARVARAAKAKARKVNARR